jgi:hypothetical protein
VIREELKAKLFGSGPGPEWGSVPGGCFDVWLEHLSTGESGTFGDVDGLPASSAPGHEGYF